MRSNAGGVDGTAADGAAEAAAAFEPAAADAAPDEDAAVDDMAKASRERVESEGRQHRATPQQQAGKARTAATVDSLTNSDGRRRR